MKVYILFFKHPCMTEILGVYSNRETAREKRDKFISFGSGSVDFKALCIIEKVLDDED